MKQISLFLILMSAGLCAMQPSEQKKDEEDVKIVTSTEYAQHYRQRLAQNDPQLKHVQYLCDKCGGVDINIPGNAWLIKRDCGHRCCRGCTLVSGTHGAHYVSDVCPVCGELPNKEAQHRVCVDCIFVGAIPVVFFALSLMGPPLSQR